MAAKFFNQVVSELCLGKPELFGITATDTVYYALTVLKRSEDTYISVWESVEELAIRSSLCIGKICMTDVILFLCREENLVDPFKAFESPVSQILSQGVSMITHLYSNSSLLEAIDHILEGTHNLAIPIQNHRISGSRKKFLSNGRGYCWLTQEDVVRFLLNSIRVFSPVPYFAISSINIIEHDIMTVYHKEPASSAAGYFNRALDKQTSVAVVDEKHRLIGEISPFKLACCNETAAAAITALSVGDLMDYIDCRSPHEDLIQLVRIRLLKRNLARMSDLMDEFFHSSVYSSSSNCSSDDESGLRRNWVSGRNCPQRSWVIACSPNSSLVAVMIQALAHRVSCVWVVEEDYTLVGAVTFAGILKVLRSFAGCRQNKPEKDKYI
ncbi:CBS domain-containing protein CBSX5-like [Primulina tabacum]|uniref:CBS domain-containing protein CBSX5-like n=1 Tax=Primulina tabacum TaxID=48773 RepID=UPI003F5AD076